MFLLDGIGYDRKEQDGIEQNRIEQNRIGQDRIGQDRIGQDTGSGPPGMVVPLQANMIYMAENTSQSETKALRTVPREWQELALEG